MNHRYSYCKPEDATSSSSGDLVDGEERIKKEERSEDEEEEVRGVNESGKKSSCSSHTMNESFDDDSSGELRIITDPVDSPSQTIDEDLEHLGKSSEDEELAHSDQRVILSGKSVSLSVSSTLKSSDGSLELNAARRVESSC